MQRNSIIFGRLRLFLKGPRFFVASVLALFLVFYVGRIVLCAPQANGWSWLKHKNSLLVVYPKSDCGCGLLPIIDNARRHGLEPVIMTNASGVDADRLQKRFVTARVISNCDEHMIKSLSNVGKDLSLYHVRYGVIVRQSDRFPVKSFYE
jgi:hypothetical protein